MISESRENCAFNRKVRSVFSKSYGKVIKSLVQGSLDARLQQRELLIVTNNIDGNFGQKSSSRIGLDALMYRETRFRLIRTYQEPGKFETLFMRTYLG